MTPTSLPAGALALSELVTPTPGGIASRVLGKAAGGSLTVFAFDAGEALSEHTSPHEAFVLPLEGVLRVTVGGVATEAAAGTIVRLPAGIPHAVETTAPARMLLVMLRAAETR